LHQQLQTSPITRAYLTGTGIRFDGSNLMPEDQFELPFGNFSTQEFAHLFSIFDGSRVHQQAAKEPVQDAPPGLYFTVINNHVIQSPGVQTFSWTGLCRKSKARPILDRAERAQ
jgi:hypothetical protein